MKKLLIPAIVVAGAGIGWLKSKFDSQETKECASCGASFEFIKRGRIECDFSSDIICSDCVAKISPRFRVRKDVAESIEEKMSKVIVMKSLDVPGYEVLRVLGRIHSKSSYRTRSQAREDLLFQCVKGGGNCILEFESFTESRTLARSFQGPMPGMSIDAEMFMAEGILAEVKKIHSQSNIVSTQNIQDLERISTMLERGHISKEEYDELKEQLLCKNQDSEVESSAQTQENEKELTSDNSQVEETDQSEDTKESEESKTA